MNRNLHNEVEVTKGGLHQLARADGRDVASWLYHMLAYDMLLLTPNRRITMGNVYKRGGDLYHGTCLTNALLASAEEVDIRQVEEDDVCASCAEPLRTAGDDIPEAPDTDDDDAEVVKEDE